MRTRLNVTPYLHSLSVQFCIVMSAVHLHWGRRYRLDGSRFEPRLLQENSSSPHPSRLGLTPTLTPAQKVPWLLSGDTHPPHLSPRLRITTCKHLIPIWAFTVCYGAIFTFISTWVLNLLMYQQVTVYPRYIWRIIKSMIYEKLMDAVVMMIPTQKLMLV